MASEDFEEVEILLQPRISTDCLRVYIDIDAKNGTRLMNIARVIDLKRPVRAVSIVFEYEPLKS